MTDRRDDDERPSFPLLFDEDEKPSVVERLRRALRKDDEEEDEAAPTLVVPGSPPAHGDEPPPASEGEPSPEGGDEEGHRTPEPRALPADAGPVQRATLQLLPGRLVPEDSGVLDQEVRFLKTRGGGEVVTLGWDMDDPPEHVTLDHPSIRPKHARMTWNEGAWWVESLVAGDEVEVNDRAIPLDGPPRKLEDGDLLRLGDVRLRYVLGS